jgi:hypothetical protein
VDPLLSHHDDEGVAKLASIVRFDATRRDMVDVFVAVRALGTYRVEDVAVTVHALEPGIRLMCACRSRG